MLGTEVLQGVPPAVGGCRIDRHKIGCERRGLVEWAKFLKIDSESSGRITTSEL